MMHLAQLQFGAPGWFAISLTVIVGAFALLFYAYRSLTLKQSLSGAALCLKLSAIAILSIALAEPLWSGTRIQPGTNLFAVLVDDSASLQITDPDTGQTRLQQVQQLLAGEDKKQPSSQPQWLIDLQQNFSVRQYSVDSHAHAKPDLQHLTFTGKHSNLISSINELNQRYQKLPLAGIILMTDGISAEEISQLKPGVPVYPVPIGNETPATDLAITNTSVTYSPFEDAPIRILADLSTTNCQQSQVETQLLDQAGKVVETVTRQIETPDQQLQIRFQVRPDQPGIAFYQIKTRLLKNAKPELT
ncbi:MAG: hypothetical protein KDA74_00235, partial [Planctomycetaceae bacterium]|nr:hypothetical protein [Planctomycetaceae bacterium]